MDKALPHHVEVHDEETPKQSRENGDDAAAILHGTLEEYTEDEERAVVRKIDLILLPVMALGAGFQFIDKSALGNAATLTLIKDLQLKGNQYSLCASLYFVGLLFGSWPANYLLQRYHTGRIIAVSAILWGATMLAVIGTNNFGSLAALRFLLGIFEAPLIPGQVVTTARFYAQKEVPLRIAIWTLANTVLPIPFSVIYFAVGNAAPHPLQPWRWIFVIIGLCTIAVGALILAVVPDSPASAWWLTPRQRIIVVERVARTQVGIKSHTFKKAQFFEALCDVRAWRLAAMVCFQQAGVSMTVNFVGQIIAGLGFTGLQSLLLQIPQWVCSSGTIVTIGILGSQTQFFKTRKTLLMIVSCVLAIISTIVVLRCPPGHSNPGMLLFFLSILNGHGGTYSSIISMAGQNFAGTTKKQTVLAMVFLGFSLSNIVVPFSFLRMEAPVYSTGIITVLSLLCCCFCTYIAYFTLNTMENKRRDKNSAARIASGEADDEEREVLFAGLQDLTDKQNPRFRYLA